MKTFTLKNKTDIGLLILRMLAGTLMLMIHGLQKLFSWERLYHSFTDPFGLSSELSYLLVIFSEVICSILVIVGLFTRFVSLPIIITMLVAAFVIHGNDPWTQRELPLLYAITFTTLFFTGAGKYSIDNILKQ